MRGGRLPDPGFAALCARCGEPRESHGGNRQLGACPGSGGIRGPRFRLREEDKRDAQSEEEGGGGMGDEPSAKVELPWRVTGLDGARSDSGPTYSGGVWIGGSRRTDKHVAVRYWAPMGAPATAELDLGDDQHGCTVSLTPALARAAAAALMEAADRAEAEMKKWRQVVEHKRRELDAMAQRDLLGRAGYTDM